MESKAEVIAVSHKAPQGVNESKLFNLMDEIKTESRGITIEFPCSSCPKTGISFWQE